MRLNKRPQVQACFRDWNRLIAENDMAFTVIADNVDDAILAPEKNSRTDGPACIVPLRGSQSRALAFDPVRVRDCKLPCLGNRPASWDRYSSNTPIRETQNIAARPRMSDKLKSNGGVPLLVFGAGTRHGPVIQQEFQLHCRNEYRRRPVRSNVKPSNLAGFSNRCIQRFAGEISGSEEKDFCVSDAFGNC